MLGFVSNEKYQEEFERRVRAEARADELARLLDGAQKQLTDALDRFVPKPKEYLTGEGPPTYLSSEVLKRTPAIGRRGIIQRNTLIAEAKEREDEKETPQHSGDGRELTEEEKTLVESLG